MTSEVPLEPPLSAASMLPHLAFAGPVFVVGMPRSGTKLLRDLLNNHSRIAIAPIESNAIPYFHARREGYGDLRDRTAFRRFYRDFSRTYFVIRMGRLGFRVEEEAWYAEVEEWSLAGVVAAYYRLHAASLGKDVWGDKSPPYMLHLPLLAQMYPEARFVHIVRDVRDVCGSVRKAWGKNVFRAAQRWSDDLTRCFDDLRRLELGERYVQVTYEALIRDPSVTLATLCAHLSLAYEPEMVKLLRPSENLGDTRGRTTVVADNAGKWKRTLRPHEVARIEAVSGAMLARLGYLPAVPREQARLGRGRMALYKLADGVSLFRALRREHGGTIGTLRFMTRTYRQRATLD